ncbi:hypothetical protein JCM14469_14310 [Desulfatiferula olefinivorans]
MNSPCPFPEILHIEACNFKDRPQGGQLNFSRQLMACLGSRLALVGWTDDPYDPLGHWFMKIFDSGVHYFFAIGRDLPASGKPRIPARLLTYLRIKRYQRGIRSLGINHILVREHAVLLALDRRFEDNLCYCFPGVEPPLSISRYPWAKPFSRVFDSLFFNALVRKASVILASADPEAIRTLKQRAGRVLRQRAVIPFPTRVDTTMFFPGERTEVRQALGLPTRIPIAVASGRLHWAKGWPLVLKSFAEFNRRHPESRLIFLGDGDDRDALIEAIDELGLGQNVSLTGHQPPDRVAAYLRASDLLVMGSIKEGWSTVLVEALACGRPMVTSRFSSAEALVRQGKNGFVVDRDPVVFATAMEQALSLRSVEAYSRTEIRRYALSTMARDLTRVWPLTTAPECRR